MSDGKDLQTFVSSRFGPGTRLEALAGDASDRDYYRVHAADGSRILMSLRAPFDPPYVPFIRMAEFLAERDLPVPRVLEQHRSQRCLILEDLGDRLLQAHLAATTTGRAELWALYEEAVDLIVRLQRKGTAALTPDVPAYHGCLDEVKLGRELEYFREHHVHNLLGNPLSGAESELLGESLGILAAHAGRSGDRVLCHRDFHSRNLMLPEGGRGGSRLVMLDFQDARLGPRAYDLVSLLCDPYVELPQDLAPEMVARFLRGVGWEERAAEFATDYAWVGAQRLLKAVGTFAGQSIRFGNDSYLAYIPQSLLHAQELLSGLEGMSPLAELCAGPLGLRDGGGRSS